MRLYGTFESLIHGLTISDEEVAKINSINPFVDTFDSLKLFLKKDTEQPQVAKNYTWY